MLISDMYRWLNIVETVGRQYAFIKFGMNQILIELYLHNSLLTHPDRVIQKRRRDYSDPSSTSNMKKLNDDLHSIQSVMRKSIDDILDRGNKLDGMCMIV